MTKHVRAKVVISIAAVTWGLLSACSGDDPDTSSTSSSSSSGSTTSSTSSSGAGSSSGGSSSGGSSSGSTTSSSGSSGNNDAGGDTGADTGVDTGIDTGVDAGPPDPSTCTTQAIAGGSAFYFTCSASIATITAGGTIVDGTYHLSGEYNCPGGNKAIGRATIFTETTNQFMRFNKLHNATASETGATTFSGTYWLNVPSAGNVTRVERCDVATKGQSETGTYQVNGNDITFVFTGHSEKWTKE